MNYVTDDFRKKIESMFPKEKAEQIINEFNMKLNEEKESLQEIGFAGDWTYRTENTEIGVSITEEKNNIINVVLTENDRTQQLELTRESINGLAKVLGEMNHKINGKQKREEISDKSFFNVYGKIPGFYARRQCGWW